MATRFLEQGLDLEKQPLGDKAPFGVERDGVLRLSRGARYKGSATADRGPEPVFVVRKPVTMAADVTATVADHGTLFVASTTASVTLSLPLAATAGEGFLIGLSVGAVTGSAGHVVRPQAADLIKFTGNAASSAMQCSAATDVLGDNLWLISDGGTTWHIAGKVGTWAGIA